MRTWNRTETSAEQPRKGFDWILAPDRHPCARTLEIVVPYIGSELTGRVMERAAVLAAGLNVALKLVAVYVAPYPADLDCPAATKEHLTSRLTELIQLALIGRAGRRSRSQRRSSSSSATWVHGVAGKPEALVAYARGAPGARVDSPGPSCVVDSFRVRRYASCSTWLLWRSASFVSPWVGRS